MLHLKSKLLYAMKLTVIVSAGELSHLKKKRWRINSVRTIKTKIWNDIEQGCQLAFFKIYIATRNLK